jgi:hypothetical protein
MYPKLRTLNPSPNIVNAQQVQKDQLEPGNTPLDQLIKDKKAKVRCNGCPAHCTTSDQPNGSKKEAVPVRASQGQILVLAGAISSPRVFQTF